MKRTSINERIEQRALEIVKLALDNDSERVRFSRGLVSADHGWGWYWEVSGRRFRVSEPRANSFEFEAGSLAALIIEVP